MSGTGTALEKALSALAEGVPLSRAALQEFSDLDPASLQAVTRLWPSIPAKLKHAFLDGLHGLADDSTLVSFDDLARQLLSDPDGQVRMRAIRLLGENQDPRLAATFVKMLASDDDPETRREAAAALGRFVELGELEEIPEPTHHQVVDALLAKVTGEDTVAIRRRALESLGYSSKPEVATLIESSFRRENPDWQTSAMVAMGLSSDERWEEHVLSRLLDENPGVRLAAVQAAGELRLGSARQLLFQVLEEEDESEVSSAAIWSLSQIGGEDVRIYVQGLLDLAEEDEDVEFLEEVLENLEFTDELNRFDLLSVEPDQDD